MTNKQNLLTFDFRATILSTGLFAFLFLSLSTQGADIVKANNASDLNLPASWTGNTLPGANDRALFNSVNTANRTTSLGVDTSWSGIALSGNTKTWTLTGAFTLMNGASGVDPSSAAADFTLAAPLQVSLGAPQTWAVANGRKVTVTASVSGGEGNTLIKEGEGTLLLNAANTLSGGTALNGGTLSIGNSDALGKSTLTISNGALKASSAGYVITNPVVLAGLANVSNTVLLTLNSDLRGPGSLVRPAGLGNSLVLGGNNTFSGGTTNGSVIQLNSSNALGSGPIVLLDAGGSIAQSANVHIASGARLDVSARRDGYTLASAQTLTGYGTVTGSVVVASGARLSAGTTNAVGTLVFQNDLTLNDGAVIDWNVDPSSGATDVIRVNGTLSLPEHATIRISGASTLPKLRVLFKASKIEGASNVRKWTVLNGPQSLHASLAADQIVLLYTGLIVSFQ